MTRDVTMFNRVTPDESENERFESLWTCAGNRFAVPRRILSAYKDAPLHRAVQRDGIIIVMPVLSGLHHHHRYARI